MDGTSIRLSKFVGILNKWNLFAGLILMMSEVFIRKVAAREFCYELISEAFVVSPHRMNYDITLFQK